MKGQRTAEPGDIVLTHFEGLASFYDCKSAERLAYLQAVEDLVVERLGRSGASRVLDAGCGTGTRLLRLSLRLPDLELEACDLSPQMVEVARRQGLTFVRQADVRHLPYGDESFDAVLCLFNVLGYLPSDAEVVVALQEFRRVLRPGGLALGDVMNICHLGEGLRYRSTPLTLAGRLVQGILRRRDPRSLDFRLRVGDVELPGFVRAFTARGVARLIRLAGLELLERRVVGYDSGRLHGWFWRGQFFFAAARPERQKE